jgi:phosphatidylserine decarboxylase
MGTPFFGETMMNERIEELYTKAYCMAFDEADDKNFLDHQMEKFAELIIRECASQVRFTDLLECNDDSDGEILLQASVQLKQHFGVEE